MKTVLLLLMVGLLIAWYLKRKGPGKTERNEDRRISPPK